MLVGLIKDQVRHQDLLGYSKLNAEERIEYIRELSLGLNIELVEFLQEMPWKPWRKIEDQHSDPVSAADELGDVFIFLLNLWIQLLQTEHEDLSAHDIAFKIFEVVGKKQNINLGRLAVGYNQKR
jgi:hypothetical protein